MKKYTRIFAFLLALVLTAALFPSSASIAETAEQSGARNPEMEALMRSQASAVEANEILMQYYYVDGKGITYPDNCAGCYIENNLLYVCFTELSGDEVKLYDFLFSVYRPSVEYKFARYSYNELFDRAEEFAKIAKEKGIAVTSYGVDDLNNSISFRVLEKDLSAAAAYAAEYGETHGLIISVAPGSYTSY